MTEKPLPPELAGRNAGSFATPYDPGGYNPHRGMKRGRADLVAAKQQPAATASPNAQRRAEPRPAAVPVEQSPPVGYLENLPQWLKTYLLELEAEGNKLPAAEATVLDALWTAQRYVDADYLRAKTGSPKTGDYSAGAVLRRLAKLDLATREGHGRSERWIAATPAKYHDSKE